MTQTTSSLHFSLEYAGAVVLALDSVWTALGGYRHEACGLCVPTQAVRVQHIQAEVCRTVDGGALHSGLATDAVRRTTIVKLLP